MTIPELEAQLLALTPIDKAEAISILTQSLKLDCYPHLSAADLVNVWAYSEAYPDEIESAIRQQDEADEI
ncbi:MAG: hypothetical protein EAZ09_01745 [Oscillatoriales cyanobacterium]|nr:MAG: hypothetical protein EAZ09_01745 [Oscillatoriales cyanobacterium]